jgi:hypothetical protein
MGLILPSFRGVRSTNPESISLSGMRPDGFRARAMRARNDEEACQNDLIRRSTIVSRTATAACQTG